jgi:hypothetical protein
MVPVPLFRMETLAPISSSPVAASRTYPLMVGFPWAPRRVEIFKASRIKQDRNILSIREKAY